MVQESLSSQVQQVTHRSSLEGISEAVCWTDLETTLNSVEARAVVDERQQPLWISGSLLVILSMPFIFRPPETPEFHLRAAS